MEFKRKLILFVLIFVTTLGWSEELKIRNFSEYEKAVFTSKTSYSYDKLEIYYKVKFELIDANVSTTQITDYNIPIVKKNDNTYFELIEDYYLVGYRNNKQIVLGYFCFEKRDGQLYRMVYNRDGSVKENTAISNSVKMLGFTPRILSYPLSSELLFQNIQSNLYQVNSTWPISLNDELDLLESFEP